MVVLLTGGLAITSAQAGDFIQLDLKCPNCGLNLVGTKETVSGDKAVFCSECGAGGSYAQIVEKRARLIPRFVSRQFVEKYLLHAPAANRPKAANRDQSAPIIGNCYGAPPIGRDRTD